MSLSVLLLKVDKFIDDLERKLQKKYEEIPKNCTACKVAVRSDVYASLWTMVSLSQALGVKTSFSAEAFPEYPYSRPYMLLYYKHKPTDITYGVEPVDGGEEIEFIVRRREDKD